MKELKSLKKRTIVDSAIKEILDLIVNQQFKPGSKMPGEREFAEYLGISRASVREALQILSFAGAVEIKPGSGTFVSENMDAVWELRKKYNLIIIEKGQEYLKVCECRKIYDPPITKLAAQNATEKDKADIHTSYMQMEKLLSEERQRDFRIEDLNFHKLIAKATQNEIIYESYSFILDHFLETEHLKKYGQIVIQQHKEILDAIESKNPQKAERCAYKHIDTIAQNLTDQL